MTALGDALKSDAIVAAQFVEIDLATGPVRAYSGVGRYTDPLGRTWAGLGGAGRVSSIEVSEGVTASSFTVGFDVAATEQNRQRFNDVAAKMLSDREITVKGRRIRVHFGVFHKITGDLVEGRLVQRASGVGSHLSVAWAQESLAMTLNCEPLIGGVWPAKGRYLTNEDQHLLHQGDLGLEFITIIANGGRNVTWNPGV